MFITSQSPATSFPASNSATAQKALSKDFAQTLGSAASELKVSAEGVVLANDAARRVGSESSGRCLEVGGSFSTAKMVGHKVPERLQREMETRAKEEAQREGISFQYASAHRYKTVAQVFVNGKFAAEINEAGGFGLQHGISGLSTASLSAQERVEDVARALKSRGHVEVRTSNFEPGLGGWMGPSAPESVLPAFTARSNAEIFEEIVAAMARMSVRIGSV